VQAVQEQAHPVGTAYRNGSPHIKHPQLYDRIVAEIRTVIAGQQLDGKQVSILDVGSGSGNFVEPVLAAGCKVTSIEMSRPAIQLLQEKFGPNPNFEALFDPDGYLGPVATKKYDVIMYASVLHHIPDYLAAIDKAVSNHLALGGCLVSFQDPLWYPSVPRSTRLAAKVSYYAWRVTQGSYTRGLSTLSRRLRGSLDESNFSDMAEYHVVRQGVNHHQVLALLSVRFESVHIQSYWSTQSALWQGLGEKFGLKSTFALTACGFKD